MTPLKLGRKHKNRLMVYARGVYAQCRHDPPDLLDVLHDFAMRVYSEGWTHGEAAEREKGKGSIHFPTTPTNQENK